ncbi:hypothetical protein J2D73_19125 [Acetobacter sacchari]|uniref:Uncharacterized protein n=1 Tax=Acetobacter sacchari TaxID=2661687 RepID=A0ABS3M166_9PROT|nr:hypothetical protein [Acetobacter sacchari]MBO1361898.1 hypothetical protein [Acetobacter sacchari]
MKKKDPLEAAMDGALAWIEQSGKTNFEQFTEMDARSFVARIIDDYVMACAATWRVDKMMQVAEPRREIVE